MEQKIIVGPDVSRPYCEFETGDIYLLSTTTGVDVVGTELSVDKISAKVSYPHDGEIVQVIAPLDYDRIVSSDGYVIATNYLYLNPRLVPYGTPVEYKRDGSIVAKMYVEDVDRVSKYGYKMELMSAIGLFETQKHYGNVYNGMKFEDVVREIIGDTVPFSVSSDLKNLPVYGWLPYDTKRANLHQLLFASGAMCAKDENGDLLFKYISNESSTPIPKRRIYYGGNVKYPAFASAVEVTEHSFFALSTDEVVTEYDNTDGSSVADHTFVAFKNAPLHDLETNGTLVVESSGTNWAIVTGVGVLTGKKYTHSTRIMRRVAENATDQKENVATVYSAYLVNVTNSYNVANRVLSYYNSRKIVTANIVAEGEKCGELVTAYDPYDEPISGFISSMKSNVSSIVKAECEIITDYTPTGQGNNYSKSVVLTGSGTWKIPDEVFDKENPVIQATIISGGHGGFSGKDGETGGGSFSQAGSATKGGAGGEPGPGGRVLVVTIDCKSLKSFPYRCGLGGESDQVGTDSSFGSYSSASGVVLSSGAINIFSGDVYGTTGLEHGVAGGDGSSENERGQSVTYGGQTWTPGASGGSKSLQDFYGDGGFGGGAAVGSNGGNGHNGNVRTQPNGSVFASGGDGGDGADPPPAADSTILGGGGNGGHGGGGGGAGGGAKGSDQSYTDMGASGSPGHGGKGGRGGAGVIIIYY